MVHILIYTHMFLSSTTFFFRAGDLSGASGSLEVTSGNYYVGNQNIEWRIEVAEGKRVRLAWQSFELETYDTAEVADPCTGLPYSW